MNPFIAKEIRLLRPAYGMALLLAIVPVCLLRFDPYLSHSDAKAIILYAFGFGATMLALSSFGREFGLKTFPLILAQPLERKRIWWTKVILLAGAMATVFGAWCLSWFTSSFVFVGDHAVEEMALIGATTTIVVFAGALWTTLLLRQVVAAFWFTILIPGAILMVIDLCHGTPTLMFAAIGFYSIAGFWLAWWQFSRAQEVAWTGGVIDLSAWRSANTSARPSIRTRRPISALLWKELQLHQMGLMGMCGLFVLHLGVVWLRKIDHADMGNTMRTALEVFGGLWFIVPVLTGSLSVSEERKLGTMQELLCLPVSRRIQFFIKLLFTLILGGLLSAVLFWTAEGIGGLIGAGSDIAGAKVPFDCGMLTVLSLIFLALSLIGFYASTMTRGIVQALAAAFVTTIVLWFFLMSIFNPQGIGIRFFRGNLNLVHYIYWPTLIPTFVWLAWRNFRSVSTDWLLWRRNLLGITAALVFIVVATIAIYNRAWELLTPLEPAHGPARLSESRSVTFKTFGPALTALLPDGRLWVDRIAHDPGRRILAGVHKDDHSKYEADDNSTGFRIGGKWISISGNQFVPGSNWVDAVTTFQETVAIRADGTLWVSEKPRQPWDADGGKLPSVNGPAPLVRYGDGTDWKSVVVENNRSVILLKLDGTLWWWGINYYSDKQNWPGLRTFTPRLLSDDSDWDRILGGEPWFSGRIYAWKKDGSAWSIHPPVKGNESQESPVKDGLVKERMLILDNTKWRSFTHYLNRPMGLREDGTLWDLSLTPPEGMKLTPPRGGGKLEIFKPKMTQIGTETNWVGVAGNYDLLVALKADGSLWAWNLPKADFGYRAMHKVSPAAQSPVRFGTHADWIAVGVSWGGVMSLAADGNLWRWWDQNDWYDSDQPMLAPSRKPSKIENVLAREK